MRQKTWDKIQSMIGQKYGRLIVVGYHENRSNGYHVWCECECGKEISVRIYNLTSGNTQSCGCLSREIASARSKTHGLTKHPLYILWRSVIRRCENPEQKSYKNYGGRSIYICDEWRHDFQQFYDDCIELGWQPELTIDRIDNDGPYCKWNVRFVDATAQARNRRTNHIVEINGERMCLAEAIEKYSPTNLSYSTALKRVNNYGWDPEQAILTPPYENRRRVE